MTFSFVIAETEIDTGEVDEDDEPIFQTIKHRIRFVDTNRLLTALLDTCVNNLSELFECNCKDKKKQTVKLSHNDTNIISKCKTCLKRTNHLMKEMKEKFPCTSKFAKNNINKFKLLLRKGVYLYEYMDNFDKFEETQLPSKEQFNSTFRNTKISDNDYKHAQKVWKAFNCKTMRDYHNLYVQVDSLLLADCFEKFRNMCLKHYDFDPCYFASTPALALEACLKKTGVEIELLTDIDMILMNEEGVRGGITQAIRKYASANNKYMKNYNPNQKLSYLMYLDAKNLYGWAMCRKLPLNNFKWIENPNEMFTTKTILDYDEETNYKGYLLEADLEYPKELHNDHSDLPFCPYKNKNFTHNTKYSQAIQIARKKIMNSYQSKVKSC